MVSQASRVRPAAARTAAAATQPNPPAEDSGSVVDQGEDESPAEHESPRRARRRTTNAIERLADMVAQALQVRDQAQPPADQRADDEPTDPLYIALRKEAQKVKVEPPTLWDLTSEGELIMAPFFWPEAFNRAGVEPSAYTRESAFIDRMVRVLRAELSGLEDPAARAAIEAEYVETIIHLGMVHYAYKAYPTTLPAVFLRAMLPQMRRTYGTLSDAQLTAVGNKADVNPVAVARAKKNIRLKLMTSASVAEQLIAVQRDVDRVSGRRDVTTGGGDSHASTTSGQGNHNNFQKRRRQKQQQAKKNKDKE